MSIKFPDWQVLVSRTDQIPKVMREGDPTGAGKVAPQVVDEFDERKKKINSSNKSADTRNQKNPKGSTSRKKKDNLANQKRGNHLDIKA